MNRPLPLLIALSVFAASQAASESGTADLPVPAVLPRLHAQLQQIRSSSTPWRADLDRPQLGSLVGIPRNRLIAILGRPDYCDPPSEDGCRYSMHWAYFFYHWGPTVRETAGVTEIAMPLQGWAMEVGFTQSGAIKSAAWVWQK
jgi:hypothetical protein